MLLIRQKNCHATTNSIKCHHVFSSHSPLYLANEAVQKWYGCDEIARKLKITASKLLFELIKFSICTAKV